MFFILTFLKFPRGVSFFLISMVSLLVVTHRIDISILVEGAFGYFDAVLTVLTAMMFIVAIEKSGLLKHIAEFLAERFSAKPRLLLLLTTILAMSGGMITGSSSASVLTTGAVAFPVFTSIGLNRKKAGILIAISSVLGMIAPPVNIQALVICEGVDMPYVGFTYPLLWLTIPTALIISLFIGGRDVRRPKTQKNITFNAKDLVLYIPLLLMIILSILDSYGLIQIGLPMIFFLSSIVAILSSGKKRDFFQISITALEQSLPVLAILVGVGMLIQVMTLSGVRGLIVANMLFFPYSFLFLTVGLGVPLFGAISSYGSASVLGIPFLLAFRGGNDVLIASAISLLAGIGDMLPPTALATTVSAQVVGLDSYTQIFKGSVPFLAAIGVFSVVSIIYSSRLSQFFANSWWLWGIVAIIFIFAVSIDIVYSKRK